MLKRFLPERISRLEIVRRIIVEKDNSQLIPSKPRNLLQKARLSGLYELLVILRVILTLNLQTGWIHQTEFTNSLEVIAGDYFDLQVFKSPTFNASFPTQSTALLHITSYVPYLLGCYFLYDKSEIGKEFVPNSKMMILIPRILNLLLSFLVDYLLIKMCDLGRKRTRVQKLEEIHNKEKPPKEDTKSNKESEGGTKKPEEIDKDDPDHWDYSIRLVTLASSQILLTFTNRSHAATLNLLLFSLLLYLVSDSLHRVAEYIPIVNKYHTEKEPVKKVLLLREMRATKFSPIQRLHWITLVIVIGLFNDPEFFTCYTLIPLFFYLQRGISNRHLGMTHFHARIFAFLVYFFTFSIPFILWDSFYYERVKIQDFWDLNLSPESFVIIPVNYFAQKGMSPPTPKSIWQILIYFFLLFNILGLMGLVSFFKELYDVLFTDWKLKPKMDSQWTFLNCSLILPILFLMHGSTSTLFDLVPLLFPLVYMHGHKIPLISRFSSKIGLLWFFCNFAGVAFWGYLSQGGILTSLLEINSQITPLRYSPLQINIVFSQMESIPPTFLLAIPSKWKTMVKLEKSQFSSYSGGGEGDGPDQYKTVLRIEFNNKVRVYHTGLNSNPFSKLEFDFERLIQERRDLNQNYRELNVDFPLSKVNFLICPSSFGEEASNKFRRIHLEHLKTYWNHFYLNLWPAREDSFHPLRNLGLNLYRMDRVDIWSDFRNLGGNGTKSSEYNEAFDKYFQFQSPFSRPYELIINCLAFLFMFILFVTSYLVFLT